MELPPNPDKNLMVEVSGRKFARYPIKTHFIESSEKIEDIVFKYVLPIAKTGDAIALCQKIVSIAQNKIVYKKDVKVSSAAKFLSKFVRKTPYGFSVGNPLKMQLAIDLAGLPRILLASFLGGLFKLFGIYGMFYRIAGNQISQIDGFYGKAFPQYSEMGILGPEKCDILCDELTQKFKLPFLVADTNDIGGNILGRSKELRGREKLFCQILKDNPAGQDSQQTPIIIIREI